MRAAILTLFPAMVEAVLSESILGRARNQGILDAFAVDIRAYSDNKHHQADDYPFGGGPGMVMMPQPIFDAFADVEKRMGKAHRIYLSPKGKTFDQETAQRLSRLDNLVFLCGHYEGVDQRVLDHLIDEEISIGDYVLTGGEIPALAVLDSVARLIPGVLGSDQSAEDESFSSGLLEYPQYTRPADFRGLKVPDILLSGHHANIERWRREQALEITRRLRPDLLK
ncbi:tRNA (guanosine(37)-N1)-methyltransferase TrmD [Gehongia tenuis]|uniref:tRNA (guanine-N(1)-)-methyltransferase n=1 Tax=Gehongia tenuis TaxID=2763655 RepID=A0A926D442_9FIRM|nr:tRNA (guanosine(37)-N1)-methyltransferase TrmD [Gehongia tenuis]MBC8530983.1 tRNA (guanosine(37)-N1)-methyltransferase TrmD [Gehongia tenuis]